MRRLSNFTVLISGGGIAGPVAAFWLSKAGASVTIVERSPTPRKTGQSLDVRGPGITVMREMGLEHAVRAAGTHEKGTQKLNAKGNVIANFEASGDGSAQSITSEYEILRADLARVFTEAVEGTVEIVYGEYVDAIRQHEDSRKVDVTFANGKQAASYDLVIGADGLDSRTRSLVRGKPARDDYHKLNAYCAYFTIPQGGSDSPTHSRYYNATMRRVIWTRPTRSGETGTYLLQVQAPDDRFAKAATAGPDAQKRVYAEFYADAGYEAERILDGMHQADDFYYQEIAQIRLDKYYHGRVALLGDAGYCPSPMTGVGTTAAMYGAYVLAGEVAKQPHDLDAALENYDTITRKYVDSVNDVPMRMMKLVNPQTQLGVNLSNIAIWMLGIVMHLVVWMKGDKLLSRLFALLEPREDLAVPEYDWEDDDKMQ